MVPLFLFLKRGVGGPRALLLELVPLSSDATPVPAVFFLLPSTILRGLPPAWATKRCLACVGVIYGVRRLLFSSTDRYGAEISEDPSGLVFSAPARPYCDRFVGPEGVHLGSLAAFPFSTLFDLVRRQLAQGVLNSACMYSGIFYLHRQGNSRCAAEVRGGRCGCVGLRWGVPCVLCACTHVP